MHNTLSLLQGNDCGFPDIHRVNLETLQVNLGYRCNQSCLHCHVNAGPKRKEQMSAETLEDVLAFMKASPVSTLDITGGAPELHPQFHDLVQSAHGQNIKVMDRCNLTILEEPGYEHLEHFLAEHQVEIIASLPCYLEENVDAQRGRGVYQASIHALKRLNAVGYGRGGSGLVLNLVYNPTGSFLPPPQEKLAQDFKRELFDRHGIVFNHLYTLTNMPIQRFGSTLVSKNRFDDYMQLLKEAYHEDNLGTVMCRTLISIDWQGNVYDCDFNQMLDLPLRTGSQSRTHISQLIGQDLTGNPVRIADHCYGCTAGQGSSCGGALT